MNKKFFLAFLSLVLLICLYFYKQNISNIEINSNSNNNILKILETPDKKMKAIAYIRDVGATAAPSPQVSILTSNQSLKSPLGNIFIGNNSDFIDIYWQDNSSLVIIYNCKDTDIIKKIDNFDNVKIIYKKSDKNN